MTTRDAATLLGVSVSTAQKWIESGDIASWKTPGGHRRIRRSAVLGLLDERTAGGTQATDIHKLVTDVSTELHPLDEPGYPVSDEEKARLRAVARTGLLDTPAEPAFDRITWLAGLIVGTPVSLLTLLTGQRQWFKSRQGTEMHETPRDWAFCDHARSDNGVLVVEDARQDIRFANNPLVTGDQHIRFYAGYPVRSPDGHTVGVLCVLDRKPRSLDAVQDRGMRALAAIANDAIRLRMVEHGTS
ncbi:excisionase family DNA binding protein [Luteibacter rhizovicinus]|uniref:Excisionase family DNA binding protein n=1 Tax=Luteibacter rhizovicinus TaxID=242606 RepID=A0A4R3YX22_9GAMM|nr:helix-turn-helix domain-containing protein [Luteibacter rhizovicinus]TCV96378.1 excisionase family DNA binding protein [Luteibacter rhizovicinus]